MAEFCLSLSQRNLTLTSNKSATIIRPNIYKYLYKGIREARKAVLTTDTPAIADSFYKPFNHLKRAISRGNIVKKNALGHFFTRFANKSLSTWHLSLQLCSLYYRQ